MSAHPRLVLVTSHDPFSTFAAGRLFAAFPGFWVGVVRVALPPALVRKRPWHGHWAPLSLLAQVASQRAAVFAHGLAGRIHGRTSPVLDLPGTAGRWGVPLLQTDRANAREVLGRVREWAPDLLLSWYCPQKLG